MFYAINFLVVWAVILLAYWLGKDWKRNQEKDVIGVYTLTALIFWWMVVGSQWKPDFTGLFTPWIFAAVSVSYMLSTTALARSLFRDIR